MSAYYANKLIEAAKVIDAYDEQELELIKLAGFNLSTLIEKLKAGYTIEPPEEDKFTPHLINCATSYDWARGMTEVYIIGFDYTWDDLTDYEKRKLYESQVYLSNNKRR